MSAAPSHENLETSSSRIVPAAAGAHERPLVVLLAGEISGDFLGADLMAGLTELHPELRFAGLPGPRMRAMGCEVWAEAEELGVNGVTEVVRHLPRLLLLRRRLVKRILASGPALVVGVDAPGFNLGLEAQVRAAGIRTAHYVSPQVWAWREGRVRQIRRGVDLMLCLLPFEKDFYDRHGVPAEFVGHPMAAQIPEVTDRAAARAQLGLRPDAPVLAVLPGSRTGEVKRQAPPFAATVAWLAQRMPDLQAVLPVAHPALLPIVTQVLDEAGVAERVRILDGDARTAVTASDAALVTSGTASLETALLRRPMVVAYQISPLTLRLMRTFKLIRVRNFALPNLLASEPVVPEFLQREVRAENLGAALLPLFSDSPQRSGQLREFATIHRNLRVDASITAARALSTLLPPRHPAAQGLEP